MTFTRNLAADIEANLRRLCPLETMSRLRVATVDGLVADHLKRHGYAHDIVFDDDPRVEEAWQKALTEKDNGLGLPDRTPATNGARSCRPRASPPRRTISGRPVAAAARP